MNMIEAKIDPNSAQLIIPSQSTRRTEIIKLKKAFPSLIDVSTTSVVSGYSVLLMVHEYIEVEKQNNRNVNLLGQDTLMKQDEMLRPMIHFMADNRYMKSLYSREKLSKEFRREYEVMDNSIWNYLVPMKDHPDVEKPKKDFLLEKAITAISDHYKKDLYRLEVTYEYADWNARLFQQSYLVGTHALDVSPHVFHSESAIRELLDKEFIKNDRRSSYTYKGGKMMWRFLLVDDYAEDKLRLKIHDQGKTISKQVKSDAFGGIKISGRYQKKPPTQQSFKGISKGDIVKKLLEDQEFVVVDRKWDNDSLNGASNADIMLEYVEKFDDAKRALKEKKYDIILLDYLLDDDAKNNIRHYGYELLEDIKNEINTGVKTDDHYLIGPSGHLFFMFMSAFTSAVEGRLLAQGLSRSEKDCWYVDTGACPTNTPQLFTYNLLQLMKKRLEDSGIRRLSSDRILELITKIFTTQKPPYSVTKSIREQARDNYHDVLNHYDDFHKMLKDVQVLEGYDKDNRAKIFNTNGSVLATHFMLNNQNLGGLLEHLVQLVHLTAFGTIRQWAEMWEEYIYVRAYFEKWGNETVNSARFKKACRQIENYIYELKSQQR